MYAPREHSSAPNELSRTVDTFDRRAGEGIRYLVTRFHMAPFAGIAAVTLGPAFRGLVGVWLVRRSQRSLGVEAAAAALTAAQIARIMRDHIGRTRPGPRTDGGMPSRHAAAAVAIAQCARRHHQHGRALGMLATTGLMGRVANASHEPLDIAAGALLGHLVERIVAGLSHRVFRGKP